MKKIILLLMILLLVTASGCTSYREIDRGYLVTAIGIGQGDNGINIIAEAMSSAGNGDNPSERVTLSASGKTVSQAYNSLKSYLTKPLYFDHLGALVIENTLDDAIALQALDFCGNLQSVSLGLYVVTTSDLQSLFAAQAPNNILGYDIIGLVKNHSTETGLNVNNQLYTLKRPDLTQTKFILPCVDVSKDQLILKFAGGVK